MLMFGLGAQAEDSQETPKCPDDPSEFKGKENDCFDCLQGAFDKLKEFTDEVGKMLDNKKLDSAEESESLKTRSEGLWDGVGGWQKICEINPKPEEEDKAETEPEGESDAEAEAAPQAEEEGDAQADTEANPEPEAGPEEADETPEAEPEAEAETEAEPDANA